MNPKAVAGRARKQEAADRKAAAKSVEIEAEEDAKWQQGSKGKGAADERADKAAEKARKKAELQRLTEEDDARTPGKRSGGGGKDAKGGKVPDLDAQISSFQASNVDDAIDAMSLVNDRDDKASRGLAASALEKHPERRVKAAFEAYKERELPKLKDEVRGATR